MTPPDHDPLLDDGPLDDDTLAVHAVVDDEATAEQRRRVARDPRLVARVAEVRAAVAAVAAPIDPPSDAVLAALRRRALDALDEAPPAAVAGPPPSDEETSPAAGGPVRDISSAPTRRTRPLPPLPAVAAVVVLLVLLGVGLLIAGGSDPGEDTASRDAAGGAAESSATLADDGQTESADEGLNGTGDDGAAADDPEDPDEATTSDSEGPSDAAIEELLTAATARYSTEADLLTDLRRIDPDALTLSGSGTTGTDEAGNGPHWVVAVREWLAAAPVPEDGPTTTVAPATGSTTDGAQMSEAFARDPVATRCDTVQRSAEPGLGPATAAALVDLDGTPVLVLSNPVEISDRAPSGIRLTVLNALDCSPRAAVLR
ncbi:MAG TPA: hypothetical protein VGO60_13210 [Iamia sp.]|jgi:hypothetical protein|nr:hypothetical protein [Iamia sp.]